MKTRVLHGSVSRRKNPEFTQIEKRDPGHWRLLVRYPSPKAESAGIRAGIRGCVMTCTWGREQKLYQPLLSRAKLTLFGAPH
uniref:Uncharacterized protein n=1 Tax=Anguilla anguilla TaxID=7936 RepID=A0A0E9ST55_ANGAN